MSHRSATSGNASIKKLSAGQLTAWQRFKEPSISCFSLNNHAQTLQVQPLQIVSPDQHAEMRC